MSSSKRLAEAGGVLPIVSRADVLRIEGAVTADSLLRASCRKPDQPAAGA